MMARLESFLIRSYPFYQPKHWLIKMFAQNRNKAKNRNKIQKCFNFDSCVFPETENY